MEPDSVTVYLRSGYAASTPLAFTFEFITRVREISLDTHNWSREKFDFLNFLSILFKFTILIIRELIIICIKLKTFTLFLHCKREAQSVIKTLTCLVLATFWPSNEKKKPSTFRFKVDKYSHFSLFFCIQKNFW